jgi:predicted SnoaL-like aldol condensation-catalyzing enzyme
MKRTPIVLAAAAASLLFAGAAMADTPQEEANKKVAIDMYNASLNGKDWEKTLKFIGPTYKQHNLGAPDGIEGFKAHIENLKKNFPQNHGDIKHVMASGDLVALHIHVKRKPEDRGMAIVDIFRIKDGKVVEHWDVVQQIPDPEKWQNQNGMF